MAIDQPEASGRAPFRAVAQRRTAGPELSWLARNGGVADRGRKFWNAVAASRSRHSRSSARSAIRQRPWCADPPAPWRDDAGMTGPTGGKRATQEDIALARCDRLPCWWRGSRPDTRPRLPRPCCERFGPHPLDPSFQRRRASQLPAGRSLLRHGCFDLFTDKEGDHRSLIHRPCSRNGEKGHAPHPISPGGAFRRDQPRLLQPAARATGSPTDSSDRSASCEKSGAAIIVLEICSKETMALTRHCPCGTARRGYPSVWPCRPDCPECPIPETP